VVNAHPKQIKITINDVGRLDIFLASRFPSYSRTTFKRLINSKHIKVDSRPVSPHYQLRTGQILTIDWPDQKKKSSKTKDVKLPFPVLFEDSSIVVVNKPPNLICHPPGWRSDGTSLVELLSLKLKQENWPDEIRPGLVHRLDRDTSGVLVFARTLEAHANISKQFALRQVKKTYQALVMGKMQAKEGTFECRIGRHPQKRQIFAVMDTGRLAITKFKVLKQFGAMATYLELYPLTGRTHQLRVQLSSYKHPILGDAAYGGKSKDFDFIKRQMLHASTLEITHPKSGKKMKFEAPLPDDFQDALEKFS